jgi:hypothetical protein
MRRISTAAAMASLLTVLVPGMASAAQRGRSRTHAHHASTRHRHVRHGQIIRFGSVAALPSAGAPAGSTTTGSTSPQRSDGPPATPGAPAAPAASAGKVLLFTGGVLTITLADGSTVSGKVTEATELQCHSATAPTGKEDGGVQPPRRRRPERASVHRARRRSAAGPGHLSHPRGHRW